MDRDELNLRRQQATDLCTYMRYALCTILYQRGVYLEHEFRPVEIHDSIVMIPENPDLDLYVNNMMHQLFAWIIEDKVKAFHLTILSAQHLPLEKYVFEFGNQPVWNNEIDSDISIRQGLNFICSTASWLPALPTNLNFKIHAVQVVDGAPAPHEWAERPGVNIPNPQIRNMPFVHIKTKSITAQIYLHNAVHPDPQYEATQMESPWAL